MWKILDFIKFSEDDSCTESEYKTMVSGNYLLEHFYEKIPKNTSIKSKKQNKNS